MDSLIIAALVVVFALGLVVGATRGQKDRRQGDISNSLEELRAVIKVLRELEPKRPRRR